MDEKRAARWNNFRRRADFSPLSVYRHPTHGWEYIPIHPFGDELEPLTRLQLRPEDCQSVDAWWGIGGDATLLELRTLTAMSGPPRLYAKATDHDEQWVYLGAVLNAPFITRVAFEDAMRRFAEVGFPDAPMFRLRIGDPPANVAG